jgi:hypothetical protein
VRSKSKLLLQVVLRYLLRSKSCTLRLAVLYSAHIHTCLIVCAAAAAVTAADLNLYNEFLKLSNGQYAELFYPTGYSS